MAFNPERVRLVRDNPFRVERFFCGATPRVFAALKPWA